MQEAYSHEVISAGWWTGGGELKDAAFYCYAAPEPQGFAKQKVRPDAAYYYQQMGEFLLLHEEVRRPPRLRRRCWIFCKARMKPARPWASGTAQALERPAEPAAGAA